MENPKELDKPAPAHGDAPEAGNRKTQGRNSAFRNLVRQAPLEPGVYLMRDDTGEIIYVGKAKFLRNRLLSYFSGRKDIKTRHLVSRVEKIEWIIAGSEYEALLLENNLIKEHRPRYNINLKDGKTYPSVRVTNEEFPRVFRTRRIIQDGSEYFGPFPSAEVIDTCLDLIKRLFPLRRCLVMRKRESPCMYYHIGRCSGPCAGRITKEDYRVYVDEVRKLLSGETESLLDELRVRMAATSSALKFEEAARLRDTIAAIEQFAGRSSAVDFDPEARDYIAWAADGDLASHVVFQMRDGKLTGRDLYRSHILSSEEEALQTFLISYYTKERLPPPRVYIQPEIRLEPQVEGEVGTEGMSEGIAGVPGPAELHASSSSEAPMQPEIPTRPEALSLVAQFFLRELGMDVDFAEPTEKRHQVAVALAAQNAVEDLAKRRREAGDIPALEEMMKILGLDSLPAHIEGFDIAQLAGKHTVASLVTFKNGVPDKRNYRYFKIKSLEGAVDDFGAIREAVARRYTKLINEGLEIPDLIMIDGGAGQVSAAREIIETLGMDCGLVGLAKRNEELWLPGASEAIILPKESPALRILVALRDETHRFATGLNQKLRAADLRFGFLEEIDGVGPSRARRLMKHFGSLEAMASADVESIAEAGACGDGIAQRIKKRLLERAADNRKRGKGNSPALP